VNTYKKGDFAVTVCTTEMIKFSSCKRRKVQTQFCGGEITSDGGVVGIAQNSRLTRFEAIPSRNRI
jgi:hypothetical protein